MNTVLVRYGHSVLTKQYTKNPNTKHAVKTEISMKTISFSDSVKLSAFSAGLRPNDADKGLFMTSYGIWRWQQALTPEAIRDIARDGC